jgi:predicted enzyme related to lactoylglutathione lyase
MEKNRALEFYKECLEWKQDHWDKTTEGYIENEIQINTLKNILNKKDRIK